MGHLTLQCSFARQIWFEVLSSYGLQHVTPDGNSEISTWWQAVSAAAPRIARKEVNSMVFLIVRALWLERNSRVFDKVATMAHEVWRRIKVEFELWREARLCGVPRGIDR